jgi:hypothetical protein
LRISFIKVRLVFKNEKQALNVLDHTVRENKGMQSRRTGIAITQATAWFRLTTSEISTVNSIDDDVSCSVQVHFTETIEKGSTSQASL